MKTQLSKPARSKARYGFTSTGAKWTNGGFWGKDDIDDKPEG